MRDGNHGGPPGQRDSTRIDTDGAAGIGRGTLIAMGAVLVVGVLAAHGPVVEVCCWSGRAWPADPSPVTHVFQALFDAASRFRGYRLPSCTAATVAAQPRISQSRILVACSPQAWAAGALPHALWNLLGLRPDALARRLVVQRPRLPVWLAWLEVRDVRVGSARVDLRFERDRAGGVLESAPRCARAR
jgi:hypothetical protein